MIYYDDEPEYEMPVAQEFGLCIDWCITCFEWAKYKPTKEEWAKLRANWYPGQTPDEAVKRIIKESNETTTN